MAWTVNGNVYTADPNDTTPGRRHLDSDGHRVNFPLLCDDMLAVASDASEAADAAAADAGQVAADKATVAADKGTVATDKGIVAADKAIVAADKAIVAADKAIVAADKGTVSTDKGIVAADKATVAADKATTQGYRDSAQGYAATATTKAAEAAASAATAASAPGTAGTSTTSMTIGTGTKSFTTQTGKAFAIGASVQIARTSAPTNWMNGVVSAYDSGTGAMTVESAAANGSGTYTDWTISVSGPGSSVSGSTSIVTVGTITSGTWQGTAVGAGYGGTGLTSYTVGDLLYASGSATLSKLAGVATGNALISGGVGTAPSWGKIGLTTHISGTLAIGNGGTGQTTAAAAFDALAPTTTRGDIIFRGASTNGRLAIGTSTQVLLGGTDPSWGAVTLNNAMVTGTLTADKGGTGVANASGSTITLGGALTISGAFTTTLTVTATTSITLPTSGTLATLAGSETLSNKTHTGGKESIHTFSTGSSFDLGTRSENTVICPTNANATITLPAPGSHTGRWLHVCVDYGGTHTVSFSVTGGSSLRGTTPTATSVNGKRDEYVFWSDGTNWNIKDGGRNS